jgi:hypothetical protein
MGAERMILPTTTVDFNGLTLGAGTRWIIDDPGISGWEESTPFDKISDPRADSYGDRDTPGRGKGRTVTIQGKVTTGTDRDQLVAAFGRGFTLPEDPRLKRELVISTAGRTLLAYAQVSGRKIIQGNHWSVGRFTWAVQFQCDDMVRYGLEDTATGLLSESTAGGITPPLTPPLVLAWRPKSGTVGVTNAGDRLTPVVIELVGPQIAPIGVINVTTNRALTYNQGLNTGEVLAIDTRLGRAVLNGDSTRSPLPGSAVTRTLGLAPGPNVIRAVGRPGIGGTPTITVRWRPAYE